MNALVGRGHEMALMTERLESAQRGSGQIVVIEGEAGSGKTRLLDETIARSGALGFSAFRAAAHEIDRDRPFGVFVDAFAIRATAPDGARRQVAKAVRTAIAGGFTEQIRYSVVEDALTLVERESLFHPMVIALDDAQWADDPSLLVLHHLGRRLRHMPVCLVITRRPPPPLSASDALSDLLADDNAKRIQLAPLAAEEVALLATELMGAPPTSTLQDFLAKAGGNPFFVTELLSALREDRSIGQVGGQIDVAMAGVRPELRMVILRRLSGLRAETANALRMAAVLGETFSAHDLALSLNIQPVELMERLDSAIASGVLQESGERLAFRHDLVREALYGDVPTAVRNTLHLQVAHALRAAGAPASQSAPHFATGAPPGDDAAVATLRRAAADVAPTEPRSAERWLSRAADLMSPTDPARDDLIVERAHILLRLGDGATLESITGEALTRHQPQARRTALRRLRAASLDYLDRCLEASALSEMESREPDIDEIERVRFAAEAVETRAHIERLGTEPQAREVLARARAVGDATAISWVLAALYHSAMWAGRFHEALALAHEFSAVSGRADPPIPAGGLIGRALTHLGRRDEALAALRADIAELEMRREMRPASLVLTGIATLEMGAGQWADAISDGEAALSLGIEFQGPVRHDEASALLAVMAIRRDDVGRAAKLLGALRGSRRFVAAVALAQLAEARSDMASALQILRANLADIVATSRFADLPATARELVRLELANGQIDGAHDASRALRGYADTAQVPWIDALADHCEALVERDLDKLRSALDATSATSSADDIATARESAAQLLAAAGAIGEAVDQLNGSLSYYEEVGATYDMRRIEAKLRALGVRRGRRKAHRRATSGWDSLTETEQRVVELATEGLTNSEVGARLFISGRTVERHLTHIYSKLGVNSRVELARFATAHQK